MISVLRLPQLSTGSDATTLVEWSISAKTPFEAGASLGLVETDKALVELPAEESGVILLTLVEAGATVGVDEPIAILGSVDDVDRTKASLLAEVGLSTNPVTEDETRESGADGVVDRPRPLDLVTEVRTFASPLARRLAREAQIELAELVGSGPGGRIVRRDVDVAKRGRQVAAPIVTQPVPATMASDPAPIRHPRSKLRTVMAERLTLSKTTTPHFYLRGRARAEALLAARDQLNAARDPQSKITLNDLIVKAVGRAHAVVPAMNTIWADDAILAFPHVDVAVAVATDGGVVTPVVRAVDLTSIENIAATTRRLGSEARASRVKQADIEGGTITVSNLGMFGVDEFAAIINPPQSAILAVGGVRDEPVVEDRAIVAGKVVSFTLSVDHRPIDGADAARWMHEFVSLIECPIRILA